MLKKILLNIFLAFLVFIINQALLAFDWRLNFWPAIIAYLLMIFGLEKSFVWALTVGFLFDLFSVFPFGVHLIIMYLVTSLLYLLVKNFLTNRSFISFLAVSFLAAVSYQGLIFLSEKILTSFNLMTKILIFNFYDLLIFLSANLAFMIIVFFLTLKFTRRLSVSMIE